MFSYLSGTILSIEDGKITLLVDGTGLGMELLVPVRTLANVSVG